MSATQRRLWQAEIFRADPAPVVPKRFNRHEEQGILNAVLKVLLMHPNVAWCARFNTGGFKDVRGQFVRFGFAGCSDILGQMADGRFLAIEVKAARGRLTDDQEFFLAKVRANGGVSGVARSIADALAIVEGRA